MLPGSPRRIETVTAGIRAPEIGYPETSEPPGELLSRAEAGFKAGICSSVRIVRTETDPFRTIPSLRDTVLSSPQSPHWLGSLSSPPNSSRHCQTVTLRAIAGVTCANAAALR